MYARLIKVHILHVSFAFSSSLKLFNGKETFDRAVRCTAYIKDYHKLCKVYCSVRN